jgi:hypothetical protein
MEAINQKSEGDRVFPKAFMSKLFAIIEAYREIYRAIALGLTYCASGFHSQF